MKDIIQIEHLTFDYVRENEEGREIVHAIKDVSLNIEEGSFRKIHSGKKPERSSASDQWRDSGQRMGYGR